MRKNLGIVFTTLLCLCFLGSNANAMKYDHTLEDKKMSFCWKVDGEKIHIKLTAMTGGWVGIGFNPSKKMKDANFILGYVKKGKVKITDEFGTSATGHKTDSKFGGTNDVEVLGGTEDKGMTTIEFSIPLDSKDSKDSGILVDADTIVLLGYGSGRKSFRAKHKYRATFSVNLGTGKFSKLGK